MYHFVRGKWSLACLLAYVLLPGLILSTEPDKDDLIWKQAVDKSIYFSGNNETTSLRPIDEHQYKRHKHWYHTSKLERMTTGASTEEHVRQGPFILVSPKGEVLIENKTIEFKCFTRNIEYGHLTWYSSLRKLHPTDAPWNPHYETKSLIEKLHKIFTVGNTKNSTDDLGNQIHETTITVRLDAILNNTKLSCSMIGSSWMEGRRRVEDSIQLTIHAPRKVALREACVRDSNCPPNAFCDRVCTCKHPYKAKSDGWNKEVCVLGEVALGQACIRDYSCPENAVCDRVCICKYPYTRQFDNWNNEVCVSAHTYLGSCRYSNECRMWDSNAACENGFCKCASGYVYTEKKCWRKVWLGDKCKTNQECSAIVEHSFCRNVTSGVFAECSCEVGYRISGRRCIPHWQDRASLKIYFIICASTLGLILLCIFLYGIKSASVMAMKKKGRNYRATIANEKNLSISKYIPMKTKPDLKILAEKDTVTFCPLPALESLNWKANQTPELRPVVISEEDKMVGIPENVILIHQKNSSSC